MIASDLYLTSTKGVERTVVRQWEGQWLPCFGGMFSGVYLLPCLPCWLLHRAGYGPSHAPAWPETQIGSDPTVAWKGQRPKSLKTFPLLSTRGQSQEISLGDRMDPETWWNLSPTSMLLLSSGSQPVLISHPHFPGLRTFHNVWEQFELLQLGEEEEFQSSFQFNTIPIQYPMYDEQDIPLSQRFTRCMMSLLLRLNNPTELLVGLMGVESRWKMPAGCPHCHPLHRLLRDGLPLINRFLSPSISLLSRLRFPFV